MKRVLILSSFIVILSGFLFAQETKKESKLSFGPRFGLDVSSTTTTLNGVTDQLQGNYQAGIMLQYGSTLFIQPECYYASYKISDTNSMNFIKIPVMLGLKFIDIGLVSFHVSCGPEYRLLLDNKDQLTGASTFSIQVGAGVDILGFITADLRYNLNDKSIADQVTQITTTPTTLNLTVGLKFK